MNEVCWRHWKNVSRETKVTIFLGSTYIWEDDIKMDLKRNMVWRRVLDLSESLYSTVAWSCEHGNEALGSLKGGKCPNTLGDSEVLKTKSALWW
jgi:hypothetical protein